MMAYDINKKLQETKKKHRRRGIWQKVVGALCCVVVFCVAYALILPVVTLTSEQKLDCRCEVHQHEENCFDADGNVICGYADYAVHTHDPDYCYDSKGNLVCPLKEIKVHEHDASCYTEERTLTCGQEESGGHEHDESCYETRTVLTCEEPEIILHTHSESCYEDVPDDEGNVVGRKLICGKLQVEEHRHTEECLADAEAEKGITLTSAEDNTATPEGGFNGYVQAVNITGVVDGTGPFDSAEGDGNDTGENNRIVRTFDTIKYNFQTVFQMRDSLGTNETQANLCFEINMYKKLTEARFDTDTMSWLGTGAADWQIEYYAEDENGDEYLALIQKPDGTYWYAKDGDGRFDDKTSINAMVLGSAAVDDEGNSTAYQTSTGAIVRQRLVSTVPLEKAEGVLSGDQTFTAGIRVRNAENESEFTPEFKAYFENNPDNYGVLHEVTLDDGTAGKTSEPVPDNAIAVKDYQDGAYIVKAACAPLYNMMLDDSNEYVNYLSWFDFSSDTEVTDADVLAYLNAAGRLDENADKVDPSQYTNANNDSAVAALFGKLNEAQKASLANIRYGRMNALGVTASLSASAEEGKGYKGCSLPIGDITFDLSLDVETTVINGSPDTSGYSAILWDYRPNVSHAYGVQYAEGYTRQWENASLGSMERNLLWRGVQFSQYGMRLSPAAYRGETTDSSATTVYDSGTWTLTGIDGTNADKSAATNANSVYTFTISGYDFDLDGYLFPDRNYGESSPSSDLGVTDFAFFGGYAQVLYVMPYKSSGTVDVKRNITLGNLEATNLSGQPTVLAEGASHGRIVIVSGEVDSTDNTVTTAITQYASGIFTKRNSFNTADSWNHTDKVGGGKSFLGTNFWGEPQWDENTYAGSDISIMGSAQLSADSDNYVRAVNLLQLFDSEALSITPKDNYTEASDGNGKYITSEGVNFGNFYENTTAAHNPAVTYLFSADPDYAAGYDTNAAGVVTYMNTVREQDLVYADKLYWNETEQRYNIVKYDVDGDGILEDLTCIGVLSEVRDCCYIDYCYIRVPVTVADDKNLVGETVCTVNTAAVWIDAGAMDSISWINGEWDSETGKNTLANYVEIDPATESGGNGYIAQNGANSFEKIEYDGQGSYSSGTAGKLNGASLLILGYKAKVNIVDGKEFYDYYSPASGESTVTWIVKNIETEIVDDVSAQMEEKTDLTIPVQLTYQGSSTASQADLFYIVGRSSVITTPAYQVDGDGNLVLDENGQAIPTGENWIYDDISSDPDHPTEISFVGTYVEDGVTKNKLYTYKIYAERSADRTNLTYHIIDAPVGQKLPEISFAMNFGSALADNDQITAVASISGEGDKRAYSENEGNLSSDFVKVSKTSNSFLTKQVDKAFGEIGEEIQYTVRFTNGDDTPLGLAYFYDNLPYYNDGRGSNYDMGAEGNSTDSTILRDINFYSVMKDALGNDQPTGDFQATVTVYFSTLPDAELNTLLTGFNGVENTADPANSAAIETMLAGNAFEVLRRSSPEYYESDSGVYWKLNDGTYTTIPPVTGVNEGLEYESTTQKYGCHAVFDRTYAEEKGWWMGYDADGNDIWETDSFGYNGITYTTTYAEDGTTVLMAAGRQAYLDFLKTVTGIFVKVENMGPNRDIVMTFKMRTIDNKAGDVYGNNAWQWSVVEGKQPIKSETVITEILSRTISGRVWDDANLNGVYDVGEKLLNGVECTLFKWDDTQQKYVPCTEDVAGRPLGTVTTGSYDYSYTMNGVSNVVNAYKTTIADGTTIYRDEHGHQVTGVSGSQNLDGMYEFSALPEGQYLVVFSGDALKGYGGATKYQVGGGDAAVNNDGVALFNTPYSNLDTENIQISGLENSDSAYKYAIAYNLTGDRTVEAVTLHSLNDLASGTIQLTNSVELYDHQDLGLVQYAGFEFPETGGAGTVMFTISGLILTPGAGIFLIVRRRRNAGENR